MTLTPGQRIIRGLESAVAHSKCEHDHTPWEANPIPAGCSQTNSWSRRCPKCKCRETTFVEPKMTESTPGQRLIAAYHGGEIGDRPDLARAIDAAIEAEREACAQIVDKAAQIIGKPYVDPEPGYNSATKVREFDAHLIEIAAGAIRERAAIRSRTSQEAGTEGNL